MVDTTVIPPATTLNTVLMFSTKEMQRTKTIWSYIECQTIFAWVARVESPKNNNTKGGEGVGWAPRPDGVLV